jgi:hypothetical protein
VNGGFVMKVVRITRENLNQKSVFEVDYTGVLEWRDIVEYLMNKFGRKCIYLRINKSNDSQKMFTILTPERVKFYIDNDVIFEVDLCFLEKIPLETLNRVHYMTLYAVDDELILSESKSIIQQISKSTFYLCSGLVDDGPIEFGFDMNKYESGIVQEFVTVPLKDTITSRIKRFLHISIRK